MVSHARKLLPGVMPALLQLPRVCGARAPPGYHFYHRELREARRAPPLASQRARRVETSQAARGRIVLGIHDRFRNFYVTPGPPRILPRGNFVLRQSDLGREVTCRPPTGANHTHAVQNRRFGGLLRLARAARPLARPILGYPGSKPTPRFNLGPRNRRAAPPVTHFRRSREY